MELFVDGTEPRPGDQGPDGLAWRDTPDYVEVKLEVDGRWLPLYLLDLERRYAEGARGEAPAAVAVSVWGSLFDADVQRLRQPAWEDALRVLRPTWCACLDHLLDDQVTRGAVLRATDPDTGAESWMIGVPFAPGSHDSRREAEDALDTLTRLSVRVAAELSARPGAATLLRTGSRTLGRPRSRTLVEDLHSVVRWLPPDPAPDRHPVEAAGA